MEETHTHTHDHHKLPPGFRFHPTDEELITYYLTNKVSDFDFTTEAVADVDLNKNEPWDLPAKASMGEKEWYFFSLRDRKYPTGLRTNRATEAGYWKTTGKDKEIFRGCNANNVLVGMKKTLVFYRGRAPKGEKTNWVMHEYRLQNNHHAFRPSKEEWVVCRVFQKSATMKRHHHPTPLSPADESETSATMLNDIDVPNFSMGLHNNINSSDNDHNNMMMMMNSWNNIAAAPNSFSSLTWPSMNSLLLTALHLRGHPSGTTHPTDHNYPFTPQGNMLFDIRNGDDFNMLQQASTSGVVEEIPHPPPPTYNVDWS